MNLLQAKQREDAAKKKAEARKLADEEAEAVARAVKKAPSKGPLTPKVRDIRPCTVHAEARFPMLFCRL